jgi:hypothetical protein
MLNERLSDDCEITGAYCDSRVLHRSEEIIEWAKQMFSLFPERHVQVRCVMGQSYGHGVHDNNWGYQVAVKWTLILGGYAFMTKHCEIDGMSFIKIRSTDGKVISWQRFWNTAAFLEQIDFSDSKVASDTFLEATIRYDKNWLVSKQELSKRSNLATTHTELTPHNSRLHRAWDNIVSKFRKQKQEETDSKDAIPCEDALGRSGVPEFTTIGNSDTIIMRPADVNAHFNITTPKGKSIFQGSTNPTTTDPSLDYKKTDNIS